MRYTANNYRTISNKLKERTIQEKNFLKWIRKIFITNGVYFIQNNSEYFQELMVTCVSNKVRMRQSEKKRATDFSAGRIRNFCHDTLGTSCQFY